MVKLADNRPRGRKSLGLKHLPAIIKGVAQTSLFHQINCIIVLNPFLHKYELGPVVQYPTIPKRKKAFKTFT